MRSLLADAVLVVHFGIAASITVGLALIWIGGVRGWRWTRSLALRILHAGAIGIVAVQSLVGLRCPLTIWEDRLRGIALDTSFVQRWVGRLLYYDLPEEAFTATYLAVVAATALAWWIYPPERGHRG